MKKHLYVLFLVTLAVRSHAQWSTDPNVNNAISTAPGNQDFPAIVSDSSGGAIIAWVDRRSGRNDIYAQWIDAKGVVQWTANGVAISTTNSPELSPGMVSDDSGGAIIAWQNGDRVICAQRIRENGVVQWGQNGVAISTAPGNLSPAIIADGSGGAIFTWSDDRRGGDPDIYAQRINASGGVQWTANGVVISAASNAQYGPTILSDGSGGAIVTWQDYRSGTEYDIYAQRINANGVVQWTANGVAISTMLGSQHVPTILSDGSGGAIITWYHTNGFANYDIYAQRIDVNGAVHWTVNGVAISTASSLVSIASDGSGGAIVTWQDYRSGTDYDIYAQRINASGVVQWMANGVAISTASNYQSRPTIVSNGLAGTIITWWEPQSTGLSVYAQRINAGGVVQWAANGIPISTAGFNQNLAGVGDGVAGAIIAWSAYRSGDPDIYAQRVRSDGSLGGPTAVNGNEFVPKEFSLHQNYPNPFNPSTTISYALPQSAEVSLAVYSVLGQQVRLIVNEKQEAGLHEVVFNGEGLSSGVYLYRLRAGEFVETKKFVLLR